MTAAFEVVAPKYQQQPSPPAVFPIILDDSPDLAETVALSHGDIEDGGLLAKAHVEAAFLSMSGYGKPQYTDAKADFGASPTSPNPMYLAYAPTHSQPGYVHAQQSPSTIPYSRPLSQTPYASHALFQHRSAFHEPSLPFGSLRPRPMPQATAYEPQHGSHGNPFYVTISSPSDLESVSLVRLTIMFATRRCGSSLTKMNSQGPFYQYLLATDVPSFDSTGWSTPQVPVQIHAEDGSGLEMAMIQVGPFTYTDNKPQPPSGHRPSEAVVSRKRKYSTASTDSVMGPTKRIAAPQSRLPTVDAYESPGYMQQQQQPPPPTASTYMHQPNLRLDHSSEHVASLYGHHPGSAGLPRPESPRKISHHLSTSSVSSLSQMSPTAAAINRSSKSPNLTTPAPVHRLSLPSPPSHAPHPPPLIRTSTLQSSPSPASTPAGVPGASSAAFNPYAMYPLKAQLKINGELEAMTKNWSTAERETQRRLVQFSRSQIGSTIQTHFQPIAPEDRQPNSICISCIYWAAKNEYHVTSVDTIYLLESLVAVRFTVEEKNRIRRNLEGFRPQTVSKGKADSEDFFKLIMGFPNPKPRNIEKDVKVFEWKTLSHALKKIISKYSASYSSTAGALSTAPNSIPMYSAYNNAAQPDLGSDLLPATASPRSASSALGPSAYHAADGTTKRPSPSLSSERLLSLHPSSGPGLLPPSFAPPLSYTESMGYPFPSPGRMGGSAASLAGSSTREMPARVSWDSFSFMDGTVPSGLAPASELFYPRGEAEMDPMTQVSSGP